MQKNELPYNQFIHQTYREHTQSVIGQPDELSIPSTVTELKKDWGSVFFANQHSAIDTLVIFVHGGVRVPTGFEHLITVDSTENIETLTTTILLNVDLGSALMASSLLAQLQHHPEIGIVWYDYTRVVGDPNRSELADQLPTYPYKGASPWTPAAVPLEARAEIVTQSLSPFFSYLQELLTEYQPKVIISPHTYDSTSGGNTTPGIKDLVTDGELRPAGMVFQENQCNQPNTDFTLLPAEKITLIQEKMRLELSRLSAFKNQIIEIGIDYPYVIPMVLPIWLKTLHDAHHLMFEIRKDAFTQATESDILALTQFMLESRAELLQ